MIIGFTGTLVCGKSLAGNILKGEYGFKELSFSSEVRKFIEEDYNKRGPINRERMQYWGSEARIRYGQDYWEKKLFSQIREGEKYYVDSFKYTDQVENFIRFDGGFNLIGFDAPFMSRLVWMLERNRPGDPRTLREFKEADLRDKEGYKTGNGQNTKGCLEMARKKLYNDGTKESFTIKVRGLMDNLIK